MQLGVRRVLEVVERYGAELVALAFDDIIARTGQRMRAAIGDIPDGVYTFEDVMDDDGLGTENIPIRLRIEVEGEHAVFDWRGSSPQVRGNINLPLNATRAAVAYSLKALLDPDVPNNHGIIDCCELLTDAGSIVDCRFPAPVAARANTSQRLIDMIIGAFADALPARVVGASNGANTTAVFSGTDPRTGEGYLYLETLGGGFGGRADRDGKDGVQVHITNTSNLPIEAIETEYPLRVLAYEIIEDSGGAGTFRGGAGLRRVIAPVAHECTFNGAGERFTNAPWGILGGASGRPGRFLRQSGDEPPRSLPTKPSGVTVAAHERLVIETPGSGGYADPHERTDERLGDDLRSGKFSEAYVRRHYARLPPGDDSSSTR